jgi:hypothetical protein
MDNLTFNNKSIIIACHFTGIYDVNRSNTLPDDDYGYVRNWADAIIRLGLTGIIFHNNFTEQTCNKYQNKNIVFVRTEYNPIFNPNVFRYLVYKKFFKANATQIEHVFLTDIGDVEVVKNPFIEPFFLKNNTSIFCGDEPKILNNEWMQQHSNHLRSKIEGYALYEETYKNATLLNCGIIGGKFNIMQTFVNDICHIHQQYNMDNTSLYTGDMGAFNYVARTKYNKQILHGAPVNTIFKAYENTRTDCWFRHK